MTKTCWQIECLTEPTPCFKMAGNKPCSGNNCLVEQALEKTPCVFEALIQNICHSQCRMSADSANNQEFLERVAERV